jgi:hypothetical protein
MPPLPPRSMDAVSSLRQLVERSITLPLQNVKHWSQNSSFKIDALGLVTLLGAEEVNGSVGHLQRRRYTEYLPLLAAFVIAGNRFTTEQPGFVIYNLTDGITSTELKGWFTRWLMSQTVNNATTELVWQPRQKHTHTKRSIAPTIAFLLVAPLLVCTILIGDWYGVGNAGAIIISIFTRVYLLWHLRGARDEVAKPPKDTQPPYLLKTLCIIRSDGKMINCRAPASVLYTFTNDCEVKHKVFYKMARRLGWLALGVHMCILGMCTLFTQIYTVILLVLSTWALCSDFDFDIGRTPLGPKNPDEFTKRESKIPFNGDWDVKKTDHPKWKKSTDEKSPDSIKWDRRQVAWARIQPTVQEETMMKRWNLLPYEENTSWWEAYEKLKRELAAASDINRNPPVTPPMIMQTRPSFPQTTSTRPLLHPNTPSTSGTYSSYVGDTPTPGASRSSSPGAVGAAGRASADPATSV